MFLSKALRADSTGTPGNAYGAAGTEQPTVAVGADGFEVDGRRLGPMYAGEALERVEEADALGPVVHRHDEPGSGRFDDRHRLVRPDRRARTDRHHQDVDRAGSGDLRVAQRRLAEVAEVRDEERSAVTPSIAG